MTALLCEQIFPVNIDVSHILRCEICVSFSAFDFLIEAVQGPCLKNQRLLEGNERFISTLARWSMSKVSLLAESVSLLAGTGRYSSTIRADDLHMLEPVNFFSLKLMKIKCLILRLGLLEGRKGTPNGCHLHEKYMQGDDPRERLQYIYSEYRSAKKLGKKFGVPPARCRTMYRFIRTEAHLTLSYFTALKRWLPTAQAKIAPISMEVVRRKHKGSEVEFQAEQQRYKKLEKYKRTYSSYMDRQRNIEVYWSDKGLFQISFQKPRQVI